MPGLRAKLVEKYPGDAKSSAEPSGNTFLSSLRLAIEVGHVSNEEH